MNQPAVPAFRPASAPARQQPPRPPMPSLAAGRPAPRRPAVPAPHPAAHPAQRPYGAPQGPGSGGQHPAPRPGHLPGPAAGGPRRPAAAPVPAGYHRPTYAPAPPAAPRFGPPPVARPAAPIAPPPVPPATPAAAAEPAPAGPPPKPKRRKVGGWITLVVLLGGLGAGGWYLGHTAPASANVGDCVTQTGEDALSIVKCGDASAQFKVAGRLENRTQIDAGLFACKDFPAATSSYWEGKDGETGLVLCLEPVKR